MNKLLIYIFIILTIFLISSCHHCITSSDGILCTVYLLPYKPSEHRQTSIPDLACNLELVGEAILIDFPHETFKGYPADIWIDRGNTDLIQKLMIEGNGKYKIIISVKSVNREHKRLYVELLNIVHKIDDSSPFFID